MITLESLLDEMVSVEEMARYPVLRFYFDGATEPQWVIPAYDMMQLGVAGTGKGLVIPHTSYADDGSGGSTSFFPIPYAKGCEITAEVSSWFLLSDGNGNITGRWLGTADYASTICWYGDKKSEAVGTSGIEEARQQLQNR